jgi:hypothetical protein
VPSTPLPTARAEQPSDPESGEGLAAAQVHERMVPSSCRECAVLSLPPAGGRVCHPASLMGGR